MRVPAQDGQPAFWELFADSVDGGAGGQIRVMREVVPTAGLAVIKCRPGKWRHVGGDPDMLVAVVA